ncbi:MAG: ABC transporter ATP-binding protein [Bacillota bacterium]
MRRLFSHLGPYSARIAVCLSLVLLQSLSELSLPTLMANIVDLGIPAGDTQYILLTGCRMLLVAFIGMTCAIGAGYLSSRISTGFGKDMRDRVFSRVESFSLREFDKFGTASLITRTTNDITQVQMVVLMTLRMVVSAPIMAIGGVIMAVSMDPDLSLTLIWALPFLALFMTWGIRRGMPLFRAIQAKIDRLNLVLRENLTGIRVVRAFNREEHEAERFDAANKDLVETHLRVSRIMASMMPLIMLTINFTMIGLIWIGSHRVEAGNLEVGGLMAFVQYAMRILFSLLNISFMFVMFPRAAASADRVVEVLDSVPEIVDPDATGTPPARGRVEFRDVTFSYPGAEEPALRNITFTAEPGEVTAIIGGTGSGKSTLINLIPRFYDVDEGAVLVDGTDIRKMKQEDLRSLIGLVPQRAVLFSGTIAENIRYGKEDATLDEIVHACRIAQAADFVTEMPEGFESAVAQGGTNFSGGQKQRLSIARAIVRKPAIYIFDDSFSALDFRTDARLRTALRKETQGATVIIVAQRVSTIMDADRILVLDGGRIVGNGTHRELLKTNPVYREIVLSQMSEEEIA